MSHLRGDEERRYGPAPQRSEQRRVTLTMRLGRDADAGGGVIGVCTDSNAQLTPEQQGSRDIAVVPLTVTVNGADFLEGVDLDADGFYAAFAGSPPTVTTAAPGPGRFLDAYRRLVSGGATAIVSVHVGSNVSGTVNAARIAAAEIAVPVELVDTGTASFAVAFAAMAASDAIDEGADAHEAAAVAYDVACRCGNVFAVSALDQARAGGRLATQVDAPDRSVLALRDGRIVPVGAPATDTEAVQLMADTVLVGVERVRVAVGASDTASEPLARIFSARLAADPRVHELLSYRIGPSVGVHTGPGTVGAVYYPIDPAPGTARH